jgi:hypothetical protein
MCYAVNMLTFRLERAYEQLAIAKDNIAILEELYECQERCLILEERYEEQVQAGQDRLTSDLSPLRTK